MNLEKLILSIAFPLYAFLLVLAYFIAVYDIWGMGGRFIIYLIGIGILISGSIFLRLFSTSQYIYRKEDWQLPENQYKPTNYDRQKWSVLFDSHFHTKYSDGKMTIEEGIHWHLAMGFNAFAITDHNTVKNLPEILQLQEKYKNQCILIPGIELDGYNGHMNVIGIQEWNVAKFSHFKNSDDIKAIIKEAHRQNAITTWNHYPWSYGGKKPRFEHMPSRETLIEWGIDFIESSNWDDDIDCVDLLSYEFCKEHPEISPVAGTDVHTPEKDSLWGWTLINPKNFSSECLMEELRHKRTDVVFQYQGIPYPTKHKESLKYKIFRPLYQFADIFLSFHQGGAVSNLNWFGIFTWVLYFITAFFLLEIYRIL